MPQDRAHTFRCTLRYPCQTTFRSHRICTVQAHSTTPAAKTSPLSCASAPVEGRAGNYKPLPEKQVVQLSISLRLRPPRQPTSANLPEINSLPPQHFWMFQCAHLLLLPTLCRTGLDAMFSAFAELLRLMGSLTQFLPELCPPTLHSIQFLVQESLPRVDSLLTLKLCPKQETVVQAPPVFPAILLASRLS